MFIFLVIEKTFVEFNNHYFKTINKVEIEKVIYKNTNSVSCFIENIINLTKISKLTERPDSLPLFNIYLRDINHCKYRKICDV